MTIARSVGLTMSVQDNVGSVIAFTGILHLGQIILKKLLRCMLVCGDLMTTTVAKTDSTLANGGL